MGRSRQVERPVFGLRLSLTQLWAFAAIFAPVVTVARWPLGTVDLAYHLRTGAWILQTHRLPSTDPYTFTAAGTSWLDQQWGAQVTLEAIFRSGGWLALAAARFAISGGALGFLFLACRAKGATRRGAALLTFASAFLMLAGTQLRPQAFGILCFAATMWLLATRETRPGRTWLVVPLAALWANLHGTFFFAPILVGLAALQDLHAAPDRWRRTLWIGGATLLATLANPFGPRVWSYAVELSSNPVVRNSIVEWAPTSARTYVGGVFFAWVAAVALLLALRRKAPAWPDLLTLGLFFAIGVVSVRGVFWWALVAPVTIAAYPIDERDRSRPDPSNAINIAIAVALVAAAGVSMSHWLAFRTPEPVPAGLVDAPLSLTDHLDSVLHPGEPFFNAQEWGSWFEYALPGHPVAVDSRIEVIPASVWRRYDDISNGREGWQRLLDGWGVRVVALSMRQQAELISRIRADPAWALEFHHGDAWMFVRTPGTGSPSGS